MSTQNLPLSVSARPPRSLWTVALLGGAVLTAGSFLAPDRVWANALLAAFFLLTVGLGGAVFLALTGVTGARWHLGMRDIPRSMTRLFPVGGILLLAVLALQLSRYSWQHPGEHEAGTFWFKELWLAEGFFAARSVVIVLLWFLLIRRLTAVAAGHRDSSRETSAGWWSALFLVVFALTFSVASWDWLMALEPMWYSTIWGVYHFAGLMLATLAVITLLGVASRKQTGGPATFTDDHLHIIGQLLFGFSCFWMYIWYSQYMLIWYTNIPEEAVHYVRRMEGTGGPLVALNVVLNFVIPFFVLLPRPAKRSAGVMVKMAVVVLLGRWVDLFLTVLPPVTGSVFRFGVWEVAAAMVLVALPAALLSRPGISDGS